MFRLGYNTNGLAHHRVLDSLELVSALGYDALSITPDVGQLDPLRLDPREVEAVRRRAEELGLVLTLESGARYLLDSREKHRPNLMDEDPAGRARRVELLVRHLELAADLGAGVLALWSGSSGDGKATGARREQLWSRLCDGLRPVLSRAHELGVRLAFEPEPGMFVERPAEYEELLRRLGRDGDELGLCLDLGHCQVTGDLPVSAVLARLGPRLRVVQLADCKSGEHVHRMFGEGDLDLPAALGALIEADFRGVAAIELSRDSHRGPGAAREALARVRAALGSP